MNIKKPVTGGRWSVAGKSRMAGRVTRRPPRVTGGGFTMMEIAISLAIIGIALVAIIGVLPHGLNAQRDNREATLVNQDASVFLQAITGGARGLDDLTNYVYAIVNTGSSPGGYLNPGLAAQMNFNKNNFPSVPAGNWYSTLTNGANIVGLMSTPEYVHFSANGDATIVTNIMLENYVSNHITACVVSLSGPAEEKPPQDNGLLRSDSFGYHIFCVNAPVAVDTNALNARYNQQLGANLHELRLTFLWPVLPNGKLGGGHQTFRTLVGGDVQSINYPPMNLYYYQSQSFTNAP